MTSYVQKEISLGTLTVSGIDTGSSTAKFVMPFTGKVKKLISNVTGDPGADSVLSMDVAGGTASTDTLTIANSSSAGTVDTANFTNNNYATAGQIVTITSNNGASNDVDALVTLVVNRY